MPKSFMIHAPEKKNLNIVLFGPGKHVYPRLIFMSKAKKDYQYESVENRLPLNCRNRQRGTT
jgi:hypothetical protein